MSARATTTAKGMAGKVKRKGRLVKSEFWRVSITPVMIPRAVPRSVEVSTMARAS